MDITEVAKLSGHAASALRYYEENGLIASIGRKGIKRIYSPKVIQQLAIISLGKNAGLTLGEIKAMLTPSGLDVDRELLAKKAEELDLKIKQMTAVKKGLIHASQCPEENHLDCPKFLRLLKVAGGRANVLSSKY